MLVYRIEHAKTGEGPFRHLDYVKLEGETLTLWDKVCKRTNKLPTGDVDLGVDDTVDLFGIPLAYGCESILQLGWWFGKLWRFLEERLGFVLRVYDVPDYFVIQGDYQVAFEPELGSLVETLTYAEYEERLDAARARITAPLRTDLPDPTPTSVVSHLRSARRTPVTR